MRTFIAFVSLIFLIVAMILFQRIGGWRLFFAMLLLVGAIHLEIGLRCDEIYRDLSLKIQRAIDG